MAKTRRVVKAHQKRKSMKSRKPRHSKKVARKTRRGRKHHGRRHHGRKSRRHMRGGFNFSKVTGALKDTVSRATSAASGAIGQVRSAASELAQKAQNTFSKRPSFGNPFKKHSTPTQMNPSIKSIPSTQPKPPLTF